MLVAILLYLFRKIYTEVVSALPVNGGYVALSCSGAFLALAQNT